MIARILALAAAVGAMIGAAGAIVVALSFALYALLKGVVTPAGASACVALALAVLCGIAVVITVSKAKGPKRDRRDARGGSPIDRFIDFAQDRPIAAAAAAIGAGLLALRSPGLAGTLGAMVLGGGGGDAKRGKRR
ncbi:MAG: hypothetical protein INR64_00795 [Caulobacteraceae bacterium]|nr:hypothetical protein [Caulobacter sp.]